MVTLAEASIIKSATCLSLQCCETVNWTTGREYS